MAARPSGTHPGTSQAATAAAEVDTAATEAMPADWMAQAVAQGIKPEQALACIGLGLMQKMAANGETPWIWNESEDGGQADLAALRQRLELVQLAVATGAPLSTAEVTQLLGARPGSGDVKRGGLRALRLGRNVWKLQQAASEEDGVARLDPLSSNGFARRF